MQTLDGALLHVEDVVDGDPVDPGLQPAAEIELRQPRDDANEDLLRRVFRILAVPEQAQGKTIDVALEISHKAVEGVAIPIDRPLGEVFERRRRCHHRSMSDFSVASSERSVAR